MFKWEDLGRVIICSGGERGCLTMFICGCGGYGGDGGWRIKFLFVKLCPDGGREKLD